MWNDAPWTVTSIMIGCVSAVAMLWGCEPQDPFEQPNTTIVDSKPSPGEHKEDFCQGQAPLCVLGCGGEQVAAAPACLSGNWSCAEGLDVEKCPLYKGTCAPGQECGAGYNCVKGMHHPVPSNEGVCKRGVLHRDVRLENCDEWGTLMPGESAVLFPSMVGSIVKFAATVGVSVNCSKDGCYGYDECCGTCVGEYAAELSAPKSDGQPLFVRIESANIPCQGGPCDLSCAPLMVGGTYRMWGVLSECTGHQSCRLILMGACPL